MKSSVQVIDQYGVNLPIEGVSIVICAKNALKDLREHLISILEQKYALFEVIVIDDGSTDDSLSWLDEMQKQYEKLQVFSCIDSLPGKKQALKSGISKARFDWVLLTDADCHASSNQWIEQMMLSRNVNTQIVLGYSPYFAERSWLNRIIRFETTITAIQYIAAAENAVAYMGVGRNILYHRDVLLDYDDIIQYELASGDDDLLVNAKATDNNIQVCLSSKAFMYSNPEGSWKDWVMQKTRHISTGYAYNWQQKLMLILYAGSQVGMLLFLTLLGSEYMSCVLMILLFRWVIVMYRSKQIFEGLEVKDLWKYTPILDLGLSLYFLLIHPLGYIMNWGSEGKFGE